jgi:hypothetical protein
MNWDLRDGTLRGDFKLEQQLSSHRQEADWTVPVK